MNGSAARSREPVQSFLQFGNARLANLWRALREESCPAEVHERFSMMLAPWGNRLIPRRPGWRSDIGDDHSPFEFSVVFARDTPPQLRLLVEAQGDTPTYAATLQASLRLTEQLERRGADLSRLRQVQPLFLEPEADRDTTFSLWHAASLEPEEPHYKAYFNPRTSVARDSFELVACAMDRLGMPYAREVLVRARRGNADEVRFFSLDLQADEQARAKVYLYQPGATTSHFERLAKLAPSYRAGEATRLCQTLLGSEGPYVAHPLCTYLSFVEGHERPYEVTMQLPLRFYCDNDEVAKARTISLFDALGLDAEPLARAIDALAARPLDRASGILTHVSLRLGEEQPRVAVYLAVELFARTPTISSVNVT